ncbi:MAG: PD-(D/E)XK motif protein [Mesorhizobium sp.]|nr:MAG: PD-(D/E)XK motif protein [Mesorhizobium sp.]
MSDAWQNVLTDAWTELSLAQAATRLYRTKLISTNIPLDIFAAIRAVDDAPCVSLETSVPSGALFEVGGMRLSVAPGERGPLLVLSLEDHNRRDLFTNICADVVAAAIEADPVDALAQFFSRLDAWRQFLRDRRSGLSREEAVGLLGELIVMEQLLASDAHLQTVWEAPDDGLHDFLRNGHALEVKTSLGPSSNVRIANLDQLEPSGLARLDLLHVRLIEAPDGRSIHDLIMSISSRLPDEVARRVFGNALLRRGLMPDDDVTRSTPRVKLRAIDGYTVTEDFPRLVRAAVPAAITDANYTLDLRALVTFAADTIVVVEAFIQGAAS